MGLDWRRAVVTSMRVISLFLRLDENESARAPRAGNVNADSDEHMLQTPPALAQCVRATSSISRATSSQPTVSRSGSLWPATTASCSSGVRSRNCSTNAPSMNPALGELVLSFLYARKLRARRGRRRVSTVPARERARARARKGDALFLREAAVGANDAAQVALDARQDLARLGRQRRDDAEAAGRRRVQELRARRARRVADELAERACARASAWISPSSNRACRRQGERGREPAHLVESATPSRRGATARAPRARPRRRAAPRARRPRRA